MSEVTDREECVYMAKLVRNRGDSTSCTSRKRTARKYLVTFIEVQATKYTCVPCASYRPSRPSGMMRWWRR